MKKILIIVDIQNGFCRYEQTKKIADKIASLSNNNLFDKIIATRFFNREGSQYTKFLNWHRLMTTPDTDIVEGIKSDVIVDKWIYTCVDEGFIKLLKDLNDGQQPTHVFVCGADTDCCVLKIATDLFERGIMPIVLTDYCDSNGGEESHKAGILVMKRLIGKKSLYQGEIINKDVLENILEELKYTV